MLASQAESAGSAGPPGRWEAWAHRALQATRRERRSPTRPEFVEGWRKALKRKLAQAQAAPPSTVEPDGCLDIWMANPVELMRAESSLRLVSEDDWTALNRIQDPTSRRSSIAARILLRIGLSRAANHTTAASDWRFDTGPHHKPTVAAGLPAINFSVSHVDQLVVVAVSRSLDVGIDVECIDQHVSKKVIAGFSHLDEQHSVGGLPHPQEIREFIRLWTLKEAYAKMTGLGHALDFKMLKFTLDPVDLAPGVDGHKNASMQFDNFYVSYKHALFNTSLAIQHPAGSAGSTEVQIISLASPNGQTAAA